MYARRALDLNLRSLMVLPRRTILRSFCMPTRRNGPPLRRATQCG